MDNKKNILDNPVFKENPFAIPEDYFETNTLILEEKILSKPVNSIFDVPEDYFKSSKLKIIENILSSSSQNVYITPNNFFENSILNITTKVQLLDDNKIKSYKKAKIIRVIAYFSAAASVAGIIWGIYLYTHVTNMNHPLPQNCKTIACLTKKDVLLKEQALDEDILEESVSDQDIEQHFNISSSLKKDTNSNLVNEIF